MKSEDFLSQREDEQLFTVKVRCIRIAHRLRD